MDIIVSADGLDDAGTAGNGGFQHDLGLFDDIQDIGQIFAVEGDFGFIAVQYIPFQIRLFLASGFQPTLQRA